MYIGSDNLSPNKSEGVRSIEVEASAAEVIDEFSKVVNERYLTLNMVCGLAQRQEKKGFFDAVALRIRNLWMVTGCRHDPNCGDECECV